MGYPQATIKEKKKKQPENLLGNSRHLIEQIIKYSWEISPLLYKSMHKIEPFVSWFYEDNKLMIRQYKKKKEKRKKKRNRRLAKTEHRNKPESLASDMDLIAVTTGTVACACDTPPNLIGRQSMRRHYEMSIVVNGRNFEYLLCYNHAQ